MYHLKKGNHSLEFSGLTAHDLMFALAYVLLKSLELIARKQDIYSSFLFQFTYRAFCSVFRNNKQMHNFLSVLFYFDATTCFGNCERS
jgi:hypothetical protein